MNWFTSALGMAAPIVFAPVTGGASLSLVAARSIMMQFGEQLIQQIGQQLGLPQSMIDAAQAAFCSQCGDMKGAFRNMKEAMQAFGEANGADQRQIDQANEDLNTLLGNAANELTKEGREAGKGGGAKSWIMAIAIAMGKQVDAKAKEMQNMANKITDKTPSLTAKFSAASQEFGIMMNALTTVIKTAGEAMSNTARKQ